MIEFIFVFSFALVTVGLAYRWDRQNNAKYKTDREKTKDPEGCQP